MRSRGGVTLLEVMVAAAVASVIGLAVAHTLWRVGDAETGSQVGATRRATRASVQARLFDRLHADIRSSTAVAELAPGSYRLSVSRRTDDGRLEDGEVTWTSSTDPDSPVVTRTEGAGATTRYDFTGLLDPDELAPALELEGELVYTP